MARVLLYSLVFRPDGVSTAILVSGIMESLHKMGHKVTVLTTVPHYNRDTVAEEQQPLTKHLGGLYYTSDFHGIRVIHIPMKRKDQRVGGRFRDYIIFHFWSLVLGLFLIGRQDVVINPSPPLTMGVVGRILAILKGAKSVYNVQELYPALTLQVGMMTEEDTLYKFFLWLEKVVYNLSHKITVITPSFATEIEAVGTKPEKIEVIPNYVVLDYDPNVSKDNPLSREHNLVDKFVIMYAGNIGLTHSFDTIVDVIDRVQDIPDLHFLIVGDGVKRQSVEQQVKERNLQNITMLPWQPLEQMPNIYGSADMAFVPLTAGTAKTTIPSKIYTIMANGVPVLLSVDVDSDMVSLVNDANCGFSVPPDDVDAMEQAVREAYARRDEMPQLGRNGQEHVEKYFSRKVVAQQYHDLIEELT